MIDFLLFLPVLILSCTVLSAIHFQKSERIFSYAIENILQLLVGAFILCVILYLVTPG